MSKTTYLLFAVLSISFYLLYTVMRKPETKKEETKYLPLSSLGKQFKPDFSSDKYIRIREALTETSERSKIQLLHKEDESVYTTAELKASDFSLSIDVKETLVAFAIGPHNPADFEIPVLTSIVPSAGLYSICDATCSTSLKSSIRSFHDQWTLLSIPDIHDIKHIITAMEDTIKKDKIHIDTLFIDVRDNSLHLISRHLSIDWSVVKELLPRYCLMVRQYIVLHADNLSPSFVGVRKMKELFRTSGYTYSRIGSRPDVRVFMKE